MPPIVSTRCRDTNLKKTAVWGEHQHSHLRLINWPRCHWLIVSGEQTEHCTRTKQTKALLPFFFFFFLFKNVLVISLNNRTEMQKWAEKQTGGLKLKMFWSRFRELYSPPVWSDNPKNVQLVSFAWIWLLNCSCLSVQKQPMYHRACLDLPQPWTFAELTRNSASSWNTLNSRVPVRVPPPDEFVSSRYEQALCFLYLSHGSDKGNLDTASAPWFL